MSYSFYFLLGQAITYLGISWNVTLFINLFVLVLFELFHLPSFAFAPFTLLIGWASIVLIPFYFLQSKTKTFLLSVPHQTLILLYLLEIILFGLITGFIFYDDRDYVLWIFLIFFHILYILCVSSLDSKLERNEKSYENDAYEVVFAVSILTSDFVFLFFSLFNWFKIGDIFVIFIAAVLSFLFSFLTCNFFKKENLSIL